MLVACKIDIRLRATLGYPNVSPEIILIAYLSI